MFKKLAHMLLVLLLAALLAGCSGQGGEGTAEGGTLYLNTDCIISITYDTEGNVTSINAESENAKEIVEAYQYLSGASCTQVIGELMTLIGEAGYLPEDGNVNISFDENAVLPDRMFEDNIKTEIQNVMDANNWEGSITVESPESNSESTTESETVNSKIPEGAVEQEDGTYILTVFMNRINEEVPEEDASCISTYIYDAEGNLIMEESKLLENDMPRYYIEYYANGIIKIHKRWHNNGFLAREFISFHDGDSFNGISTEFDATTGEMTFRTTEGNPDGSGAIAERWSDENGGEYYVFVYDSPYLTTFDSNGQSGEEAKVIEERFERSDRSGCITYDYEANTMHSVGYNAEGICDYDMISDMTSGARIQGWSESTHEDGYYRREEWKDGKRAFLIEDGCNYMGYTVKNTTEYYPNGNVKSFERYFYIDSGHYYVEYDENGTETFTEITTKYY
ncbi:MAG: hypothetical protein J6R94_02355 [Agathobacter sp.]|nr:hypothetical protein [Agathobacter sp.]